MNMRIHPTSKIVTLNGIPARVWEGETDGGLKVHAFISRVACARESDSSELEQALRRVEPPSVDVADYPGGLRL